MDIQKDLAHKVPFFASSVDPNKIALTVKGVLVAIVPVILFALKAGGIEIGEGDIQSLIDSITAAIIAVGGAISAVMLVWGGIRKFINR